MLDIKVQILHNGYMNDKQCIPLRSVEGLWICSDCGTPLEWGDNIYEDMCDHWYCPNTECPASELYKG